MDPTVTLIGKLEDIYEAGRVLDIKEQFASAQNSMGTASKLYENVGLEHVPAFGLGIKEPEFPARAIALSVGEHMLGRHDRCQILIHDPYTSRFHCLVTIHIDGRITLRDLKSRNGTWVNGMCIPPDEKRSITPGTHIQIGGTILQLTTEQG